ncbi:MAG: SPOR domain-containing protein [Erythrobacter sp.]
MERTFKSRSLANRASPMLALVIPAALAGVSFASYGAAAAPQSADALVAQAETALKSGQADKAIAPAEAAVAADPLNADTRALLGAAYLGAGRFMAAAATFEDALDLGHEDARTVLSYALAKTAIGDARVAVAALDEARGRLSAADYGLALALAGQPERGVKVLVDAVRFEEATPKLRQNLAYAYALSGNWRAARVMAAEDVPAGQIDARMVEWAATAAPDQFQQRIASLLKVTPATDMGQPAQLALANFRSAPALAPALAEAAPVPPVAAPAAPRPAETFAASFAEEAPRAPIERVDPTPSRFADAAPAAPAAAQSSAIQFVSSPVVQALPAAARRPAAPPQRRMAATAAAASTAPVPAVRAPAPAPAPAAAAPAAREVASDKGLGSHLVQLGSYNSKIEAERGWNAMKARFPQLKDHDVVITEALVNGRTFFRVAAAGFGPKSAAGLCSTLKSAGRGCFAYLATNPPAGAVDKGVRLAARSR